MVGEEEGREREGKKGESERRNGRKEGLSLSSSSPFFGLVCVRLPRGCRFLKAADADGEKIMSLSGQDIEGVSTLETRRR